MRVTWVAAVVAVAASVLSVGTAHAAPPEAVAPIMVVEKPGTTEPPWDDAAGARRAAPSSTTVTTPGATFVLTYREPIDPALKPVFAEAGRRWGAVLSSPVPIQVVARQLADEPDVNGIANTFVYRSPDPRVRPDTGYPAPLLSALLGADATVPNGSLPDSAGPECRAVGCDMQITITGTALYTGLDGRPPADRVDALSLVSHEIGHGLGFTGGIDLVEGGAGYPFAPTIYDRFLADASGRRHTDLPSPSAELRAAIEDNPSFFVGPAAVLAHNRPVRVFTTKPYLPGVSIIHTSAVDLPRSVMNTGADVGGFFGVVNRIDTTTVGILADLGWPMRNAVSLAKAVAAERRGAVLEFPVALAQPAAVPVVVAYCTKDGSAKAGKDYARRAGTITIPAGKRFGIVRVPVLADDVREPAESMTVELTAAAGARLDRSTAPGTIVER